MPILLRANPRWLAGRTDLSGLLLGIRRVGIAVIILLGYLYFRFIGESYALVASGLVSFAAAAQFAPPILIGLYWKQGQPIGGAHRIERWFSDLGLHPAVAFHGPLRLDRHRLHRDRTIRHRTAQALRAIWPRRLGSVHAFGVLEHAGQHRRAGIRLTAEPAGPARTGPKAASSSTCSSASATTATHC